MTILSSASLSRSDKIFPRSPSHRVAKEVGSLFLLLGKFFLFFFIPVVVTFGGVKKCPDRNFEYFPLRFRSIAANSLLFLIEEAILDIVQPFVRRLFLHKKTRLKKKNQDLNRISQKKLLSLDCAIVCFTDEKRGIRGIFFSGSCFVWEI